MTKYVLRWLVILLFGLMIIFEMYLISKVIGFTNTDAFTGTHDPTKSAIPTITHAQDVYIYALEWCESRAKNGALNPKDRDGTPSHSNFQFKPLTLKHYAVKYGLLSDELEEADYTNWAYDYELTHKILMFMVNDKSVDWDNEFPICVKNKIGYPPTY
jgi:hypothetical protein